MQFDLRNADGERLDHTFTPGAEGEDDIVVIGHGVTANKDRPFLVALAEGLAQRGIASLRFSFDRYRSLFFSIFFFLFLFFFFLLFFPPPPTSWSHFFFIFPLSPSILTLGCSY